MESASAGKEKGFKQTGDSSQVKPGHRTYVRRVRPSVSISVVTKETALAPSITTVEGAGYAPTIHWAIYTRTRITSVGTERITCFKTNDKISKLWLRIYNFYLIYILSHFLSLSLSLCFCYASYTSKRVDGWLCKKRSRASHVTTSPFVFFQSKYVLCSQPG